MGPAHQIRQSPDNSIQEINNQPRSLLAIILLLILLIGLVYAPAINAYFISDDFATVAHLFFNKILLDGQELAWFLLASNDGGVYFRPVGQLMYLVDSLIWGLEPLGYHLTNLLFHIFNSLLTFLLAWRLTRNQVAAAAAMLLFAIMPIHAEAVSWIAARYDIICGFFYLTSVLCWVLYRHKEETRLYLLSIAAFVLALSSKEVAITLPLAILMYDLVFGSFKVDQPSLFVRRHLPFWLVLAFFIGTRLLVFGKIGFRGAEFKPDDWWYWLDGTLINLFDPFLNELGQAGRWFLLGVLALILIFYRSRPEVVFGLAWIPVIFITTINSGPSARSFYIPSFGWGLAIASILARPLPRQIRFVRSVGIAGLLTLGGFFGSALITRNQLYYRAGEVAQAIPAQVKTFYPTLPKDARLVFVGVPDQLPSGILVYLTGLAPSLQLSYKQRDIQVLKLDAYPDSVDELDRTFFFRVDHRRVFDETERMRALLKR